MAQEFIKVPIAMRVETRQRLIELLAELGGVEVTQGQKRMLNDGLVNWAMDIIIEQRDTINRLTSEDG